MENDIPDLSILLRVVHIQTLFLVPVYSIYYTRRMYFYEIICNPGFSCNV